MKYFCYLLFISAIMTNCDNLPSINTNEDRVQTAFEEKGNQAQEILQNNELDTADLNILFVAYKDLDRLELFAKSKNDSQYKRIQQYKICARSGILGPKKAEGDKQVPEGFYHINRYNPKSKFYLSLGLNYPNAYDLAHNYSGTDIFIHGKCMTVGCLPMTDEYIKEIYLYAIWAKNTGQQEIPVYIFPFEMTEENMLSHKSQVDAETYAFWQNIQQGYLLFQENKKELGFTVVENKYQFTY